MALPRPVPQKSLQTSVGKPRRGRRISGKLNLISPGPVVLATDADTGVVATLEVPPEPTGINKLDTRNTSDVVNPLTQRDAPHPSAVTQEIDSQPNFNVAEHEGTVHQSPAPSVLPADTEVNLRRAERSDTQISVERVGTPIDQDLEDFPFSHLQPEVLTDIAQLVEETNFSKLPHILASINGKTVRVPVDTGAAVNVIQSSLVPTPNATSGSTKIFTLACGPQPITSRGEQVLSIKIGEIFYDISFHLIDEVKEEIILGVPFLRDQAASVDFARKCIYIGRTERQTVYWGLDPSQRDVINPKPTLPALADDVPAGMYKLLDEFSDLFENPQHQPTTYTTKHTIKLKSTARIYKKPYPMSEAKREERMLQRGVIAPIKSSFSSPPVIVKRPGKIAPIKSSFSSPTLLRGLSGTELYNRG